MANYDRENPVSWSAEFRATLGLAWPLIIAQLAGSMLFVTDVIMMGRLGPDELAAGALATALLHPVFLGALGVVTATAPLIAQAIGARETRNVRRYVRQGFWAATAMMALIAPILLNSERIFLSLGQPPGIAALSQTYLNYAVYAAWPGLLIIALRSLLQARGKSSVVLWITVVGVFVNALGNYALMFGNFGFPRLELAGAGISTSIVNFVMFALALLYVLFHRRFRRYHILLRLYRPDWQKLREIFRIGTPIGLTIMSEVGMFGVAVIMMGWLGTSEVAAHAIAGQCAAIAFMVPLGLSQATTVRVGLATGANMPENVRKAGWTSMGLTLGFMSATCVLFLSVPGFFVSLFLDPSQPGTALSLMLAASYLMIAALFQLVDGAQCIMAAALRGMSDTRTPMLTALTGYWLVGLSTAYVCGFMFGLRGVGIWIGLASGLAFVAIVLTARFAIRERLNLMQGARARLVAAS